MNMRHFQIHPQLLADSHRLGKFSLCHLLLHKNATVPWFILLPESDCADLLDLPDASLRLAMAEAAAVSHFIKADLGWPKVNFAAIGNVVPQLHLHVVGRKPGDACWPAPVWGHLTAVCEYSPAKLGSITELLDRNYALRQEQRSVTE
jgi:diadenosine tetraphosphate (Ap4A) HIT family hydrolase